MKCGVHGVEHSAVLVLQLFEKDDHQAARVPIKLTAQPRGQST